MTAQAGTTVLDSLGAVGSRLRARRLLEAGALASASALALALVAVVLGAILAPVGGGRWPVVGALFLGIPLVLVLLRPALSPVSLDEAARVADEAGGLHDTLKSALWFSRAGDASPWVRLLLERGGRVAAALDPAALVPMRMPGAGWVTAALTAGLVVALWWAPSLALPPAREAGSALPAAAPGGAGRPSAAEAALADALAGADARTRARLEKSLATLRDPGATDASRREALEQAAAAAARQGLEAAAARERLAALADDLAERKGLEGVARALREGDARRAAELMRAEAGLPREAPGETAEGEGQSAPAPEDVDALRKALDEASSGRDSQGEAQGRLAKAVQDLENIARRLDAAEQLSRAGRRLAQAATELKRETSLRAARFGREQSAGNPTAGPETGESEMKGGAMYRLGAVAQEKPKAKGEEASRAGDSTGNAPGDPVVGDEARKLDVRFRRENLKLGETEDPAGADSGFYAASRQATSRVEPVAVDHVYRRVGESALSPERIALRHRAQVKQFFLENTESQR